MQNKIVIIGNEAINKIVHGVNVLADIVGMTLGPAGKTVVLQDQFDQPKVTKDGVTVARHVSFSDPIINTGAAIVLQAAKRTVEEVGDGTTTSTVLAQHLVNSSINLVKEGLSAKDIVKGMRLAQSAVIEQINNQKIEPTEKLLVGIATTSMNGDSEIGELIGKAMWELGPQASFNVEAGMVSGINIEKIKGIRFDRGFQSPLFINDAKTGSSDYKKPLILLTDMKIETLPPNMVALMEECLSNNNPFIIMCEEMKGNALQRLLIAKHRGSPISVVKVPAYGHGKIAVLEDLAAILGAKVISEQRGETLNNVKVSHLGKCDRMISTKNHTIIYGGNGTEEAIKERFDLMQHTLDTTTDAMEKFVVESRFRRLKGGLMLIKIAGDTPSETDELKDRVDDAVHAVKAAYNNGVTVGGGMALQNAVYATDVANENWNVAVQKGYEIVENACYSLFDKMLESSQFDTSNLYAEKKVGTVIGGRIGIDFSTGEVCDLVERGIVDPTSASINALQNAVSVAITILNIGGVVVNDPNDIHLNGPAFNFDNGKTGEDNI